MRIAHTSWILLQRPRITHAERQHRCNNGIPATGIPSSRQRESLALPFGLFDLAPSADTSDARNTFNSPTSNKNNIQTEREKELYIPSGTFCRKRSLRRIIYVYNCKAESVSNRPQTHGLTGHAKDLLDTDKYYISHKARTRRSLCRLVVCFGAVSIRRHNSRGSSKGSWRLTYSHVQRPPPQQAWVPGRNTKWYGVCLSEATRGSHEGHNRKERCELCRVARQRPTRRGRLCQQGCSRVRRRDCGEDAPCA